MLYIRVCPDLSFATKRIGPPFCTLFTFVTCYSLQITLSQNYLLPIISVFAENTLLKTACHFLLLLIGFDTLTYRKDYDRSLYLWVVIKLVMMVITTVLWRWRSKAQDDDGHIISLILIACDVYPFYASYFA